MFKVGVILDIVLLIKAKYYYVDILDFLLMQVNSIFILKETVSILNQKQLIQCTYLDKKFLIK
jgi:hypothetical protein